jgi:hypothetical protein
MPVLLAVASKANAAAVVCGKLALNVVPPPAEPLRSTAQPEKALALLLESRFIDTRPSAPFAEGVSVPALTVPVPPLNVPVAVVAWSN